MIYAKNYKINHMARLIAVINPTIPINSKLQLNLVLKVKIQDLEELNLFKF
jgi:metal-sulfur cluster biosynthetic enzyme